jgi:predicted DNA-binding transcriptional regulator YafY
MAVNKNALIRYKVLDNCFRNPSKKYFLADLIDACNNELAEIKADSNGISRRQIFDDIAFMESTEGWSVDMARLRDGKKVYYRYLDPSFSINNMPLNEIEINQLQSAVDILSQFKGMPQFEWINELIPKLRQGLTVKEAEPTIIEFDANQYLKGIEHLGSLHNAIHYKKVLSVLYQPFENDKPFELELHPYYLKQYNNRWFVFGFNPEKGKHDWNLAIDRIVSFKELIQPYHLNTEIDWVEYFEDIIGVTKPLNAKLEQITLQFFGITGKYIASKPIHGSQKHGWVDSTTLEVNLQLMINYELERFILSYADSVKIIQPTSLADKIADRIKAAISLNSTRDG